MFATIFFSWLYSMGFFVPLLAFLGPEGTRGSIQPYLESLLPCLYSKSKEVGSVELKKGTGAQKDDENAEPSSPSSTEAP